MRRGETSGGSGSARAIISREGDRVTTLELFFDLAFVFAFTQLSRLMAGRHDAIGILQALVTLALLWWAWTAYGWLSNLAHADRGIVRSTMIVGMTATFVAGLVVLEAYDDLPGGLFAPVVFVAAYLIARVAHGVTFVWLSEPALRRRTATTVGSTLVPTAALLIAGAVLGQPWQVWFTLAAAMIEPIVSFRTSAGVDWPVRSAAHFAERHGLIVILALGESILSIGAGVASRPISVPILIGVVLSMLICVALWWAYFTRLAPAAEHALAGRAASIRGRVATEAYTYLHLVLVGGIVLAALGLEAAMAHIDDHEPLGLFGAAALCGGLACYLSGTAFVARRLLERWLVIRLGFTTIIVVSVPVVALLAPVAALSFIAVVLLAFLISERLSRRPRLGLREPA